jgi:hypothetical protein
MQSWMQSLNIKRPAERASRVVASTILIDCSTVTAAAAAISSDYSVPTILTDYYLYYSRSVPLLDLFYC